MANARLKTEREVARLKSPGRHSVGGNLVIQVGRSGSRSWIARVTDHLGRRRDIGLGSVGDVSLGRAREKVGIARSAIDQGCDPVEALNPVPMPSFEDLAREFHAEREPTYRNAKHCQQWITTLETYVFPFMVDLPVDEVHGSHVMAALQPIWLAMLDLSMSGLKRLVFGLRNMARTRCEGPRLRSSTRPRATFEQSRSCSVTRRLRTQSATSALILKMRLL